MKRVLFVDDESHVLDALRLSLRKKRHEWDMVFAHGGEAGLSELEGAAFDVLVTDMRMPKVDGVALLERGQELHPEMIRIVLSGFSGQEAILRTLPIAHQFLNKPCDSTTIENTIERACDVQRFLDSPDVRKAIGSADSLPALPRNYQALNEVLVDEFATVRMIAEIIERDIAMSAKLLQIANSAFFGLARRLRCVADAITYLGLHLVKNLVLSIDVFGTFGEKELCSAVPLEALHRHSLQTARIAHRLLDDPEAGKDAFAAAVLHDVGTLVLASQLPEVIRRSVERSEAEGVPLHVAESELHPFGHAEVGAYLLGRWGLPYPIVEAVAFHHTPGSVKHSSFDLVSAVHVADGLVTELGESECGGAVAHLDLAYLERLGVADRLPEWREIAQAEIGAPEGIGST